MMLWALDLVQHALQWLKWISEKIHRRWEDMRSSLSAFFRALTHCAATSFWRICIPRGMRSSYRDHISARLQDTPRPAHKMHRFFEGSMKGDIWFFDVLWGLECLWKNGIWMDMGGVWLPESTPVQDHLESTNRTNTRTTTVTQMCGHPILQTLEQADASRHWLNFGDAIPFHQQGILKYSQPQKCPRSCQFCRRSRVSPVTKSVRIWICIWTRSEAGNTMSCHRVRCLPFELSKIPTASRFRYKEDIQKHTKTESRRAASVISRVGAHGTPKMSASVEFP